MSIRRITRIFSIILCTCLVLSVSYASALGSQQNPQNGSLGLEGTVQGEPPSQAATIDIPSNGQVFTATPITVSGLCKTGLLVKVFANNVFVGSQNCVNGSYSLKADLFGGRNDLVSRVFDNLDQQGPDSNVVTVTFNDAQFAKFGTHVALSSSYARRGADPGATLTWPLILSGGTGPYAISIDWGDSSGTSLLSEPFPGVINATHIYKLSGVYAIIAKATDANNTSAYLQLIGVANGKISGSVVASTNNQNTVVKTVILWQPLLILLPILLLVFWLGRRHELSAIRKAIESGQNY